METMRETTTLGNGVEMPLVGLGVMHMYGSECVRAICEAVDTGYRMIDTAAIYGNEGAVGKGVRECGADRDELFITTKLWVQDASCEHAKEGCETSLRNLGVMPEGWAPFAEGRNDIFHHKLLTAIGKKYGKTPAQVILRWDIQRGVAVVPKSSKPARIRENYDIWDFELTAEEMKQIGGMDQGRELFFEHDSPELARMFGNYHIH